MVAMMRVAMMRVTMIVRSAMVVTMLMATMLTAQRLDDLDQPLRGEFFAMIQDHLLPAVGNRTLRQ